MIIIIDNYDSFTYNICQYVGEVNSDIEVYRNDRVSVKDIIDKKPSHILLSPGPGLPKDAGITIDIVRLLGKQIPILGICLGHQAIAEAFGGRTARASEPVHGKVSEIELSKSCRLFDSLPTRIRAGRYHSMIVDNKSLPKELEITAKTASHEIMGIQHRLFPVYGLQFHPESILTLHGKTIIKNFLSI